MIELLNEIYSEFEVLFQVILIILATAMIAKFAKLIYLRFMARNAERGGENLTTYKFLQHSITIIIYLVGFSFAISKIEFLKPVAFSLAGGAGILAIAIGFASQQALGNIISGVFIVISKPYQINDRISFRDGMRGVVEDIGLRHTVIRNFENQRIIIPNSIISNEILINSNFADTKICKLIDIGISYGSDIDLAKKIMAEEAAAHPLNIDNRTPEDIEKGTPRILVRMMSLGDSSVNLRAWAWASDPPNAFVMECDVIESIKKRFDKEGIVIPFPQRTISYLPNEGDGDKEQGLT